MDRELLDQRSQQSIGADGGTRTRTIKDQGILSNPSRNTGECRAVQKARKIGAF